MSAVFEQRACEILDGHLQFLSPVALKSQGLRRRDRRGKPRLDDSLPARVWGIDIEGEMVSFDGHLDNLSSTGLFVRIPWQLKLSSQISLVVRLLNGSGAMAAIRGKVLRDEPQLDGSRGIAVRITEHSFL
jgi:Tfp pilus assembly protein PilZ